MQRLKRLSSLLLPYSLLALLTLDACPKGGEIPTLFDCASYMIECNANCDGQGNGYCVEATGERACECGDFPTTINTPDEPR